MLLRSPQQPQGHQGAPAEPPGAGLWFACSPLAGLRHWPARPGASPPLPAAEPAPAAHASRSRGAAWVDQPIMDGAEAAASFCSSSSSSWDTCGVGLASESGHAALNCYLAALLMQVGQEPIVSRSRSARGLVWCMLSGTAAGSRPRGAQQRVAAAHGGLGVPQRQGGGNCSSSSRQAGRGAAGITAIN